MTTTTNAENLQYKSRFYLICLFDWVSLGALAWLEKSRLCFQILNKLHNDALRYRSFSLGKVDPFYRKTLISLPKIKFK